MENKCALISVFDKEGIVGFARELSKVNIQIISSGGTSKILEDSGLAVKEVSDLTGFPEMLDGRVKTLHPIVHAGILARRDTKTHMDTLLQHNIQTIDFVICNLYPFEKTIQKPNVSIEEVIENIDISSHGFWLPGHIYTTDDNKIIWSPASSPLHNKKPKLSYVSSIIKSIDLSIKKKPKQT